MMRVDRGLDRGTDSSLPPTPRRSLLLARRTFEVVASVLVKDAVAIFDVLPDELGHLLQALLRLRVTAVGVRASGRGAGGDEVRSWETRAPWLAQLQREARHC